MIGWRAAISDQPAAARIAKLAIHAAATKAAGAPPRRAGGGGAGSWLATIIGSGLTLGISAIVSGGGAENARPWAAGPSGDTGRGPTAGGGVIGAQSH
jgi:hypothetical protein